MKFSPGPMKLTSGRIAERFRESPMFSGLMLRPNSNGLFPFTWRHQQSRRQPKIYGRMGNLEVRLARKKSEIRQAQRLRYKVFYEEMSAVPGALAMLSRRDEDQYDAFFDHLLVVDRGDAESGHPWRRPRVVGTYRLLRQDIAEMTGTTLHTVSRILSAWEHDGLVDAGQPRKLLGIGG